MTTAENLDCTAVLGRVDISSAGLAVASTNTGIFGPVEVDLCAAELVGLERS